jgi:hypothetical protein
MQEIAHIYLWALQGSVNFSNLREWSGEGNLLMNSSRPRYDVICDPLDMWMVWDHQAEEPACFGGQVLNGLTEGHAVEVAKIMNEIYGNGSGPVRRTPKDPTDDTTLRYAG